ncbi:hypothetical protein BV898_04731 [Hypsibius exemplaris]|uniref:Uncharacterized protein n=1 Tax=Hypsibius exemplaris TaxID=2072580 RepID=A0A1W0X1A4_HYPEX|nr:hypothetical protein BV898_04731 [Hypsibius exemplaris]
MERAEKHRPTRPTGPTDRPMTSESSEVQELARPDWRTDRPTDRPDRPTNDVRKFRSARAGSTRLVNRPADQPTD